MQIAKLDISSDPNFFKYVYIIHIGMTCIFIIQKEIMQIAKIDIPSDSNLFKYVFMIYIDMTCIFIIQEDI